jgi:hypothetical protein
MRLRLSRDDLNTDGNPYMQPVHVSGDPFHRKKHHPFSPIETVSLNGSPSTEDWLCAIFIAHLLNLVRVRHRQLPIKHRQAPPSAAKSDDFNFNSA